MNVNNPKVSVLIPVYNCEQYLRESIKSILDRTFRDFEFPVISEHGKRRGLIIISGEQFKEIDNILQAKEWRKIKEVRILLTKKFGVECSEDQVMRILRKFKINHVKSYSHDFRKSGIRADFFGKAVDTCWNQNGLSARYPDFQNYEPNMTNDIHNITVFDTHSRL